ncbi:MAG TPA: PEP/pyruvate-binding domain-containing protein [Anaerolineales bacterium]
MKSFVLPLSDPQATLENVGGKGLSLAKMIDAGFPVPNGFHVTTAAYLTFIAVNDLQTKILAALEDVDTSLPTTLETVSDTIRKLFDHSHIPADLRDVIVNAYQALGDEHAVVAVRSSATAEDLPGASFAGQQETYLNIHGIDEILDAVKKCWASLWTARAIAYRAKQNIDPDSVALAVVVQEMVDAEAAGILFTANPINGHRDEMVINAAWGLGEAIVGGLVSPDTIVADKATGKVKTYDVAEKTVITVRTEKGTREDPLDEARRHSKVMKEAEVVELANIARRIESYYGGPQDIEWCHAGGRFYIVQSRPITTLPKVEVPAPTDWKLPKGTYAVMRNNIVELMADPLSPLFETLGRSAINTSLSRLMDESFGMRGIMPPEIIIVVNHYAYNNGSVSAMGMARLMFNMGKIARMMFTGAVERWTEDGRPHYFETVENWQAKNWQSFSSVELVNSARQLTESAIDAYGALVSGVIPAAWITEAIFTNIYNRLIKRRDDPSAPTYLLGFDSLPIRADKSLYSLAEWVRQSPALAQCLERTPTSQLVAFCESGQAPGDVTPSLWQDWRSRFHQHLRDYGHMLYDLDFVHPVPADDPAPVLDALKLYLNEQGTNPYARQRESAERREKAVEAMRLRLRGLRLKWFNKYLASAQKYAPLREDGLAEIGLAYPLIRQMLRELGNRFVQHNVISTVDEIFWLTQDEVLQIATRLDAGQPVEPLVEKIPQRKAEHRAALSVRPPMMLPQMKIIGFDLMSLKDKRGRRNRGDVIKGVAASPGVASGVARVLHGPEDFGQMKPGDVLVAPITTPAWTPLFAMASAVVTDIGGPLSHGSIVAREYGIPAVLGTGVATRRIHSGDIVEVNGTEGKVIIKARVTSTGGIATEWKPPNPKGMYARGSLCEHLPNPVSPLFGTLGVRMVNIPTKVIGEMALGIGGGGYQYRLINGYMYLGMELTWREWVSMAKNSGALTRTMFKTSHETWLEARKELIAAVALQNEKDVKTLSPSALLESARELMIAIGKFYTVIQASTLPAATTGEVIFTRLYKMVSRKDEPQAETLLFGLETTPLRAEKSLFDLGMWTREHLSLRDFTLQASTEELVAALETESTPEAIPTADWREFKRRFEAYLDEFGHTTYEFDFMNPTPAETPAVILDALKLYSEGKGSDPHARQRESTRQREETLQKIRSRFKLIPNRWFDKSANYATRLGPDREDSIADLGMGHTTLRRMLGELGKRLAAQSAIKNADDIYWLIEDEVSELASLLERNEVLPDHSARVSERKAVWHEQMKLVPPAMLPENSIWAKMLPWNRANTTSNVLTGVASSAGKVTGTARVLFGPEDFGKMKHGDVLVAVTTTPAWTPLFAMASAIVTDLGGPLSHSSIVAREYGIPAVVSTGVATRRIQDGQTITVDGGAGTVELK